MDPRAGEGEVFLAKIEAVVSPILEAHAPGGTALGPAVLRGQAGWGGHRRLPAPEP